MKLEWVPATVEAGPLTANETAALALDDGKDEGKGEGDATERAQDTDEVHGHGTPMAAVVGKAVSDGD